MDERTRLAIEVLLELKSNMKPSVNRSYVSTALSLLGYNHKDPDDFWQHKDEGRTNNE